MELIPLLILIGSTVREQSNTFIMNQLYDVKCLCMLEV